MLCPFLLGEHVGSPKGDRSASPTAKYPNHVLAAPRREIDLTGLLQIDDRTPGKGIGTPQNRVDCGCRAHEASPLTGHHAVASGGLLGRGSLFLCRDAVASSSRMLGPAISKMIA